MTARCRACGGAIESDGGPGRAASYVRGIACQFVTARAAARRMTARGSGVILSLNSGSANGSPMMGGTAAGAPGMDEAAVQGIRTRLDGLRMTKRSPRIADIAALATFLASDAGVAVTGTWVNATAGMFPS
ncbi:hypothetical protein [Streptomyces sp. NPDC127072]|uniref:hypothetical protein n=1 Tax=Streptomyces sp. NPDC127072 TaxID=3347129 RepID=UPI003656E9CC